MNTPLPFDKIVKERYRISKILGQGGQCFVYEVDDLLENKKVVLKELRCNTSDPVIQAEDIGMFKKEYEILSTLDHPGLPEAYDYFNEGEEYFLVVQCINGKNMEILLRERNAPFEEAEVIVWGIQLAETLVYLYGIKPYPIIVRDIKPSNIVISEEGRAVMVDFTVARELRPSTKGDTVRIGSPGYAPPEQYKGLTDHKSDIYSLGVTLYRLLTGIDPARMPFQFEPLRHCNPKFSRKLEYVISRAIELDPQKRYQRPDDLLEHLKYVKDELSGISHPEFIVSDFEIVSPIDAPDISEKSEPVASSTETKSYSVIKSVFFGVLIIAIVIFFLYKTFMVHYLIYQGNNMFNNEDTAGAKDYYRQVLKLEPDNLEVNYHLGILYFYAGDKTVGEEYLGKLCSDLNLAREKIFYHYNKAKELKSYDIEKARKEFEIAKFLSENSRQKVELPDQL